MALRQGNCVKRGYGATSLNLQADAGESFLVKGIYCEPNSADTYLVVRVDRKTVAVYRVYGKGGNHLGHIKGKDYPFNIMEYLAGQGINVSIPVAEGQIFSISGINAATEIILLYDIYDAADIRPDMPNGSAAKEYTFLQYMESSATADASEDLLLDTAKSPAEFPDFPCGKVVPARHTIEILGLVGNPVTGGVSGSNEIMTTFVKLIKDRETLFDEDRAGIIFRGQRSGGASPSWQSNFSLIGGCHDGRNENAFASAGYPLMFKPVLTFVSGEELLVYVTFALTGSISIAGSNIDLAAIMHVKVE
jgi:hypothetical protein